MVTRSTARVRLDGLSPNCTHRCWYLVVDSGRVCARSNSVQFVTAPQPVRRLCVSRVNAVGGVVEWTQPASGAHKFVLAVTPVVGSGAAVQALTVSGETTQVRCVRASVCECVCSTVYPPPPRVFEGR